MGLVGPIAGALRLRKGKLTRGKRSFPFVDYKHSVLAPIYSCMTHATLPSTRPSFTAVFGMGTGVSPGP